MRYTSYDAEIYGMNSVFNCRLDIDLKMASLEDKISRISLAAVTGAACAAGGFMLGWAKASDVDLRYGDLCKYGPTLLTAGAFGAYTALETYSTARKEKRVQESSFPIVASSVGGAVMGGSMGIYHTFFFFVLGYVTGKIIK